MRRPNTYPFILFGVGVVIVIGVILSLTTRPILPIPIPTTTAEPFDLMFQEVYKSYKNTDCHEQEVVGIRVHVWAVPRIAVRRDIGVKISINGQMEGVGLGHLAYYRGSVWLAGSYFEDDEAIVIELDALNEVAESDESNNRMVIPMDEFNAMPLLYINTDC